MSILSTISNLVTPAMLGQVASVLGIQTSQVEKAMNGAVPGLLAALLGATTSEDAQEALAKALTEQSPTMLDDLGGALDQDATAVATSGRETLSSILGDGAFGDLASTVQSNSGMSTATAGSLVGLAGSLVIGALGKMSKLDGLDAPGVLSRLRGEAGDIAKALPVDFAEGFRGAGLLSALDEQLAAAPMAKTGAAADDAAPQHRPARVPVKPGRPLWQTALVGLVILGVLGWALGIFGGGEPTQTTDAGSAPLVVDGTDVGAQLQAEIATLETTLASITDPASAEQAAPALTAALETFEAVGFSAETLPAEGKAALQAMVAAALPDLRDTAGKLMGDSAIAQAVGPILQQILGRLQNLT